MTPGLFLVGTVIRRNKRLIGEKMKELVTYTLENGMEVQVWQPSHYIPLGNRVCLPVTVTTFEGRNGINWKLTEVARDGDF